MAQERTTKMKGNPLVLVGPELKPGDSAPDFDVTGNDLAPVKLADTGKGVRIFSVVPSLDTPVCDQQTRRFNEEAAKLGGIEIFTVSCDLPFAQKRWCGAAGVDKVKTVSDYRNGSFGEAY
jgi:thioredoxin-dependent peroxiredoxin